MPNVLQGPQFKPHFQQVPFWTAVTTIIYNMAIAVAAVNSL
jgi:hypothetical protein